MFSFEHKINETERRTPIRKILSSLLPEISQIQLRRLILDGKVFVNDMPTSTIYRGRVDDLITISLSEAVTSAMLPESLPLTVIFEDDNILVVDKPAGMLVHPSNSQKSGTLLNAVCYHLKSTGQSIRPGLIHRLDRQTSGLIVIAKTSRAHRIIARQFTDHLVEKKYLAIAIGHLPEDSGIIDAPIGSDKTAFPHWQIMDSGRSAITAYSVVKQFQGSITASGDFTLLEMIPRQAHQSIENTSGAYWLPAGERLRLWQKAK